MKVKLGLILMWIMVYLVGCTGFKKVEAISCTDYYSEQEVKIPLKIPYASPTTRYISNTSENENTINSTIELFFKENKIGSLLRQSSYSKLQGAPIIKPVIPLLKMLFIAFYNLNC